MQLKRRLHKRRLNANGCSKLIWLQQRNQTGAPWHASPTALALSSSNTPAKRKPRSACRLAPSGPTPCAPPPCGAPPRETAPPRGAPEAQFLLARTAQAEPHQTRGRLPWRQRQSCIRHRAVHHPVCDCVSAGRRPSVKMLTHHSHQRDVHLHQLSRECTRWNGDGQLPAGNADSASGGELADDGAEARDARSPHGCWVGTRQRAGICRRARLGERAAKRGKGAHAQQHSSGARGAGCRQRHSCGQHRPRAGLQRAQRPAVGACQLDCARRAVLGLQLQRSRAHGQRVCHATLQCNEKALRIASADGCSGEPAHTRQARLHRALRRVSEGSRKEAHGGTNLGRDGQRAAVVAHAQRRKRSGQHSRTFRRRCASVCLQASKLERPLCVLVMHRQPASAFAQACQRASQQGIPALLPMHRCNRAQQSQRRGGVASAQVLVRHLRQDCAERAAAANPVGVCVFQQRVRPRQQLQVRLEVIVRCFSRSHERCKLVVAQRRAAGLAPKLAHVHAGDSLRRRGQGVVHLHERRPCLPAADARVGGGGKVGAWLLRLREGRRLLACRQPRLQQLAEDAELPQQVAPVHRQQDRRQPSRRAPVPRHVSLQLRDRVRGNAGVQQQRDELEVAPFGNRRALVPPLPPPRVRGLVRARERQAKGAGSRGVERPLAPTGAPPRSRPCTPLCRTAEPTPSPDGTRHTPQPAHNASSGCPRGAACAIQAHLERCAR